MSHLFLFCAERCICCADKAGKYQKQNWCEKLPWCISFFFIGCAHFFKFCSQKTYFKPRAIIRPNMANMPPLLKLYSWPHIQENKSKGCSEKCREMTVIKRSVLFLIYHVVAPLFSPPREKKTIFSSDSLSPVLCRRSLHFLQRRYFKSLHLVCRISFSFHNVKMKYLLITSWCRN